MEDLEKFVEIPDLTIYRGVKVTKNTKLTFENYLEEAKQKIEQHLENLTLIIKTERPMDNNKYIKTELKIDLVEGDILLFDEDLGYAIPQDTLTIGTVEEALDVVIAKQSLIERCKKERETENKEEEK